MKLIKSMVVASGLMLLMTGAVHAKDEPKTAMPAAAPAATHSAVHAAVHAAGPATPSKAKAAAPMDINTATAKQLASLPKIGDVRAAAIIKGRPYKAKDELVDKKILSYDVYSAVKDLIIAKQKPAKK